MYPHDGQLHNNTDIRSFLSQMEFRDSELRPARLQTFRQERGSLFTRRPCITDIQQMSIGNCYLLAALQALALRDPEYLCNMMTYDQATQRTCVRLFSKNSDDTFTPFLFRIEKTRLTEHYVFDLHAAPWVHMIEKAYAGLRIFAGNVQNIATLSDILECGHANDAFEALLGRNAIRARTVPERFVNREEDNTLPIFPHQAYQDLFHILRRTDNDEDEQKRNDALRRIFPDPEQRADFALNASDEDNRAILDLFIEADAQQRQYHKILRRIDLDSLLDENGSLYRNLSPATRATLSTYVNTYCPLKRGLAGYIQNQIDHFDYIFRALASRKMVCVGTDGHHHFWNRQHTEARVKGLVCSHAYTVVNAYIRGGRKILLLRNPWYSPGMFGLHKTYVRNYQDRNNNGILSAEEKKFSLFATTLPGNYNRVATSYSDLPGIVIDRIHGITNLNPAIVNELNALCTLPNTFELEASDLTKRFSDIYISEQ